ncbi:MAG: PAS domain S-box protein, partial [Oxalobacteraceae bacterium]
MNHLLSRLHLLPDRLTSSMVAVLYAVFAGLWIVASGTLLTFAVVDPALLGYIELTKGLVFVTVTSTLLYLLLKVWREPAIALPKLQQSDIHAPEMRGLAALFLILALVVPLIGLAVSKLHGPQLEQQAYANLELLARLKAKHIESWLAERGGNGMMLAASTGFAAQVDQFVHQGDAVKTPPAILDQLDNLRMAYDFDSIMLLDTQGRVLTALGQHTDIVPALRPLLDLSLARKAVQRSDIYRDASGRVRLDWVVPITVSGPEGKRAVAAVLLRVLPEQFLFPLIQTRPTASPSAEIVLVRRERESVVFLSTLRHRRGTALTQSFSAAEPELPAAVAVRAARPGTLHGSDYRGVAVLAAYHPVAGTDWHLLAKIDRAEVRAPLHTLVLWISLIACAAIIALSVAILLRWRGHRQMYGLALLAQTTRSDRLLRQFFDLPFVGMALLSPLSGRAMRLNDHLCTVLGYAREELMQKHWSDLTDPEDAAIEAVQIARIKSGQSEGYAIDKRFIRKDGVPVCAAIDVRCVRQADGSVDYFVLTVQDISARKEAEAKIQRLTQLYAVLSLCNQSIVRCASAEELFPKVCSDAVQFGGIKMAWIGLIDQDGRQVIPVAAVGEGIEYLTGIQILANDNGPAGRGPTSTAIREQHPVWCQDFQNDSVNAYWHERGALFGWGSSAALPLYRNGVVVGSFSLYTSETNAFDAAARKLLTEMATDISFALDNFARESARQQAEQELRDSEERYRAVTQSANDAIITADEAGHIVSWNRGAVAIFGYTHAEALGKPLTLLMPERYRHRHLAGMQRIQAGGASSIIGKTVELAGLRKDMSEFPLELLLAKCEVAAGWFMTGTIRDISMRKQHEAQLQLAAKVFEQSGEGITITDARRNIVMINHAFTTITGYSAAEAIGKNPRLLSSGHQDQDFYRAMWKSVNANGHWQGEVWNRRKNGSIYPEWLSISQLRDASGTPTHYIGIFSDISQHKAAQEHIQRLAHFDALTGLPNRSLLKDRVDHALGSAQRNQEPLALMFLDLDHFKNINDSLGHRIGDELLIALSKRLSLEVREQDTVSRLGGDEFIMVLPNTDPAGAAHVAGKLLKSALQPYHIEQYELTITPSIGIAMYPGDGDDFDTLSKRADAAMYRAKQSGRNNYCFFTAEMQARSAHTLELENALRRALERDQLLLHYQPQVCLEDGRIVGAEALLRWQHPDLGMVSPADFIPIAEDSGQILRIGEWVLRQAARQCQDWIASGLAPITIAVNLSAVQFRHPRLPELVMQILDEVQLPPQYLELELTEGVAMDNPLAAIAVMDKLHERGIRMSIDDFGTGYSSLSYLKRFKVYKLKID